MKGGYESLSWINDKNGKEYVCSLDEDGNKKSFEDLTEEEKMFRCKQHCRNRTLVTSKPAPSP